MHGGNIESIEGENSLFSRNRKKSDSIIHNPYSSIVSHGYYSDTNINVAKNRYSTAVHNNKDVIHSSQHVDSNSNSNSIENKHENDDDKQELDDEEYDTDADDFIGSDESASRKERIAEYRASTQPNYEENVEIEQNRLLRNGLYVNYVATGRYRIQLPFLFYVLCLYLY